MTVIATGYKVDGLPSEEEEEGKKTISEAIEENYPPQNQNPMEDEPVQTIDLSATLFPAEEPAKEPREHTSSASADEVVITIEDEPKEEAQQETHRSPFGWIRRK